MADPFRKKTWFLAPTWEIPPSAIRLGYLVADPMEPRYPLNPSPVTPPASPAHSGNPPPIDTEIFLNKDPYGFSMELSRERSTKLGLWAESLHTIGLTAEVKLKLSKDMLITYAVEEAQTEWFSPSIDFVRSTIRTRGVADFLDMASLKHSLYMIIGVKSMKGASISTCYTKGHSASAKFGFDGTSAGAPTSGGPEFKQQRGD
ncbi:uncharacterized protein BP5553_05393 [Venustampulla echinocandica]|uniref:Uncharacterized protein n=1 Tax=Venustampulla echinocandica TaxID=2656787 RepID=A0A370TR01_9HELO|nr:uncharacterized protein BP5553_05393 [Venustampulla echinocandica]RDL37960.1 hypothetical protein BP5553_05393 [Venustampulla echinocandica]